MLNEEKILSTTLSEYSPELLASYQAELIISDGGSKDASVEIAKRHTSRVTVHKESHRQTIAAGRNAGAMLARGDVIVFINGDTLPEDFARFFTTVSDMANLRGRYASCDAIACAVDFPARDKNMADKLFHTFYNNYVWLLNAIGIGAGRGECQIVRKSAFFAVHGYREQLAAGEDFDLFARMARKGKVGFSRECKVIESPRRFRKFGYFRVLFSWTLNAISVMVRGRSYSDDWEPVR